MNKSMENFEQLYNESVIKITSLTSVITSLQNQIDWFKRQIFGQKSERFVDMPGQEELLPGFELPIETKEVQETPIASHVRKSVKNKEKFKLEIPENLPRETVYKDIPEEQKIDKKTGERLVKIGEEKQEKLGYRTGSFFVMEHVYPKYALKNNALAGVKQALSEDSIIEGSKFDVSFMAYIAVEKFCFHMPIYRVREKLDLEGIKISDQTLCGLLINLGQKVQPLVKEMKKALFEQEVVFTDDTPVDMIVNGLGKTKEGRMWGYVGNKPGNAPYHLYEFSSNRCEIWPLKYLENFKGIIHADAYSAYEKIGAKEGITWAACWAHGRRKFENSNSMDEKFRVSILVLIRNLFRYERVAWNKSPEERLGIRQEKEKPIVDKIFRLFNEKIRSNTLLPASDLAKAIGYMQSREKNFRAYLCNPFARMENNTAERAVRKLVIGRKNWLFVGSPRSGEAMANLFSLVQTCRAIKIDPQAYLEDIFKRLLSHPHDKLRELLPDQWKKNFHQEKKISSNS